MGYDALFVAADFIALFQAWTSPMLKFGQGTLWQSADRAVAVGIR
jgi:hypothetical protein